MSLLRYGVDGKAFISQEGCMQGETFYLNTSGSKYINILDSYTKEEINLSKQEAIALRNYLNDVISILKD